MPDETDATAGADESTSDAPETDATEESTSEEQGDDVADESTGDPEDESESDDGSDDAESEPAADDDEDPEYKNLVKKFAHITNERDRRAAIARTFWEKTNFASRTRKENEELKLRLARLEGAKPEKEETPAPPPPDLKKVTDRIESLYQRNQQTEALRGEVVKELNSADRELAIAEDRLKDVGEDDVDRRALAQARVRQARLELEHARDRYGRVLDKLETLNDRMEQALAEKDFIERFHSDQKARQTSEQKRHEQFTTEFPRQVDSLTTAAAKHLGLQLDERLSQSLWRHVNRALQADIRGQYLESPVEEIPIPDMVLAYAKEWAEDRELVKRKTFAKASKEKLAVSRPGVDKPGGKAPGTTPKPAPASSRPAVSTALLTPGATPAMSRARKILVERFG